MWFIAVDVATGEVGSDRNFAQSLNLGDKNKRRPWNFFEEPEQWNERSSPCHRGSCCVPEMFPLKRLAVTFY